jgi:hypothetical protein
MQYKFDPGAAPLQGHEISDAMFSLGHDAWYFFAWLREFDVPVPKLAAEHEIHVIVSAFVRWRMAASDEEYARVGRANLISDSGPISNSQPGVKP